MGVKISHYVNYKYGQRVFGEWMTMTDTQGVEITFDDVAQAKDFLRTECGYEEEDIDQMRFPPEVRCGQNS